MKKGLLLICLFAVCAVPAFADDDTAPAPQGQSALVQTTPLQKRTLWEWISGYGSVAPAPAAVTNLNFPRSGVVDRLFVTPGQRVAKRTPLLEITTDPAGTLAYTQAANADTFAHNEMKRMQALFAQQLATRSQVDAAEKAVKDADEALAAQRALGDRRAKDTLAAPFDGVVAAIAVAQGDRFAAGANLVRFARAGALYAVIGVEEEDTRQLHIGMGVRLTSVFEPDRAAEGEVERVEAQVDTATELVNISISFKNGAFIAGTRVRGDIAAASRTAFTVPRQAVLRDAGGAYLFQVEGGRAHRVEVETGIEDGGYVEVGGTGLRSLPVVVLGNYELEDGMTVREEAH